MKLRFVTIQLVIVFISVKLKAQDFATLRLVPDGGYYKLSSNMLYFKFSGEYNAATLKFNVYNDTLGVIASNSINSGVINSTSMVAGNNEYSINCTSGTIFPTGYYLLEVINEKKEKFYLRFKK